MTNEAIFYVVGLALGFILGGCFVHRFKKNKRARKCAAYMTVPHNCLCEQNGRTYIRFTDGLSLIFEDDEYVGFYTQEPYV